MTLHRTSIVYSDEIGSPYAVLRAWDRHLLRVGLLPIGTNEVSKVGLILLGQDIARKLFYEYQIDGAGHIYLSIQELPQSLVRKAHDSTSR